FDTRPLAFELKSNYPNPFNPATKLVFTLPKAAHVSLQVFDALGREIATLVDEIQAAGTHEITFDAANLPSGVYLASFRSGDTHHIQKMLLTR
ncbi:T9SS type A sorting domain-containing protein, partial [bacterium]|nr:T9SS type A sorting domain-containing protein [bacterium]